ncbi:hypothetical protein ABB37_01262 [Leptomonas pyrrhocoris]|uniref:Uncharacterized protein n=1 Tax=Leptomonas pyrrhocoris TaxID=157538 RepID=A0A0N0VH88_LEPPY|nr:hypothetical protein ABB37_01262 [Leptomonas pyrrhocoris]KPA84778.1 hypothetical protein ABB37_01262 [Leptomonas pyrrhocoris]|eukprot:XP_015663217.1 hypothetical protein ABB37_01262 [Leptomonas pyrrhocoris]
MRLTAGKIYVWGGLTFLLLIAWNRHSTKQLRTVVDSIKEEKKREAERLRMYQQGGQGGGAPVMVGDAHMPKHFNPYYKQQEMENASADK